MEGAFVLDSFTLQIVFALTALISSALFFTSYRATGSKYSLFWTLALLLLMAGGAVYILQGTSLQAVALPLGDALSAAGLSFAWGAARALRLRRLNVWAFIVPAIATALGDPGANASAGALVRYATFAVVFALTAREVWKADAQFSRVSRSLLFAAGGLSAYYTIRFVLYAIGPAAGDVLTAIASEESATLVTEMALITVSFGMVSISHAEREWRLRATAKTSALELSEGVQVQQALLPVRRPAGSQFPVSGACVPSKSLSGDFFDWQSDSERLVITVGDVMGKGVGAAMLGATIRAGLRVARHGDPVADVVTVIESLGDDLVRNGSFVTLFHAYLDRASNVLSVLDAGHGLGVLVRHEGSRERISSVNLPLGLDVENSWTVRRYTLEPGDRLLVFSDGVLDLFDGTVASLDRAIDVALASGVSSMDEAVDRIRELADGAAHEDDVTIVALERPMVAATAASTS
jgi:serine phosphatase RsbU (regulator of sigma subunit)